MSLRDPHLGEWIHAVRHGDLQHMHEMCRLGLKPPDYMARMSAQHGHLECLKFAHDQGCPLVEVAGNAAANGHKSCLEYVLEQGCDLTGNELSGAAVYSQIECMKVLIAHGCPWGSQTTDVIARNGTMECLIFAHMNGCPWDAWTARRAAQRFEAGYCEREFLEYVIKHGALEANKPRIDSSWFEKLAAKYYWPILRQPYKARTIQRYWKRYKNRTAARQLEKLLPVDIVTRICGCF